ncbi:MAG: O-antigen ligase family protein, partial [Elusimicrobiota bacterium]
MVSALFLTQARGAWAGLAGSAFLWWLIWGKEKIPAYKMLVGLLILLLSAYLSGAVLRPTQRLLIWRDSLKMAADNVPGGIGIGEFRNVFPSYASDELLEILPQGVHIVNYAHNEFIDLFSETGLTGLGVFLWFLVLSFYYG